MRLLLTGVSAFTGVWFARALAGAGHEVVAALRGPGDYDDPLRAERMAAARAVCAGVVAEAPFGSDRFRALVREGFDAVLHHGAEAAGHKSPDFDVEGAVRANTLNAAETLAEAAAAGARRLVFTGTAFEADEGAGEAPLRAFSPYGLSKTISSRVLAEAAAAAGLAAVKFVVPNPFGPLEARTFQRAAMEGWREGRTLRVSHPLYVRDNVPVDLLALAYVPAVEGRAGARVSPSFYAGEVGAFFRRMAEEVAPRTGWACALELAAEQTFDEPRARTNLQPLDPAALGWSQAGFWDAYAAYYAR